MAGPVTPESGEESESMPFHADPDPTLDPKVQEAIGRALRAYSDDIVNAPIPDKFIALLAKLEASERDAK